MTIEEALDRAEQLLFRIEAVREQLEGTEDPEKAVELIGEVSQLAKEIEAELQRAKRDADARVR
jgi:hypothetical protein